MSWGRRRRSFLRIAQIPFPSISNTFPFPLPLPQTDTLKASWRSERCSVRTHCSASEELLCDLCRSHIKASPPSRPHVLFTATRARAHVLSALYIHMCVCVWHTAQWITEHRERDRWRQTGAGQRRGSRKRRKIWHYHQLCKRRIIWSSTQRLFHYDTMMWHMTHFFYLIPVQCIRLYLWFLCIYNDVLWLPWWWLMGDLTTLVTSLCYFRVRGLKSLRPSDLRHWKQITKVLNEKENNKETDTEQN